MSGGKNTTQTTTIDPKLMNLYQQNYQTALGVANAPFTPYGGELVAGLNADQTAAGNLAKSYALNQPGSGAIGSGIAAAQGVLGSGPERVTAGLLRDTDLAPYMNPYTQNVIDSTLAAQNLAWKQAQLANNQAATAAKAFGGSRAGVLGAQTNAAFDRNTMEMVARLNQDAFANAQSAAVGDINRKFGADQFNVGTGLQNQAQHLQAAGVLGNLGEAQFGNALDAARAYGNYGTLQQATQQAANDAKYQEFLRMMNDPLIKQQVRNSALNMIPAPQSTTTHQSGSFLGGLLQTLGPIAQTAAAMI